MDANATPVPWPAGLSGPLVAALVVVVLVLVLLLLRVRDRLRLREAEAAIRRDAVTRSESAVRGRVAEHLAPLLPDFPFAASDARFLGSPVDFVVFDGLGEGVCRRVVLVEVKTGAGRLSRRERLVRDAVREGRVEWQELRLSLEAGE